MMGGCSMGDVERCKLTDEELEALKIEIPKGETDASFFNWMNEMIEEVFNEEE